MVFPPHLQGPSCPTGIGTVSRLRSERRNGLPRLHRAGPSASLDEELDRVHREYLKYNLLNELLNPINKVN